MKRKTKSLSWKRKSKTLRKDSEEPQPERSNSKTRSLLWEPKTSVSETRPSPETDCTMLSKEKLIWKSLSGISKPSNQTSLLLPQSGKTNLPDWLPNTQPKELNLTSKSPKFCKEPMLLLTKSTESRSSKSQAPRLLRFQFKIQELSTWSTYLPPISRISQPSIQNSWPKSTQN